MSTLTLQGLTKRFGNTLAIDNLDLQVEPHKCCVLFGCSGAGKTTLLRMIAGLEPVDSGQISIDCQQVTRLAPSRRSIAMVSQDAAVYPQLSLRRNLRLALKRQKLSRSQAEARIQRVLSDLGIERLQDRLPAEISGGEAGRLAFARALVARPKLLLLDEPLSQLDGLNKQKAIELLEEVREKFNPTLMLVSHDPIDALRLADQLVVLDGGQIIDQGPPNLVYHKPRSRLSGQLLSPFGMNWLELKQLPGECRVELKVEKGKQFVGFRPEAVQTADDTKHVGGFKANVMIESTRDLGFINLIRGRICDTNRDSPIEIQWLSMRPMCLQDEVEIRVPDEAIRFVDR